MGRRSKATRGSCSSGKLIADLRHRSVPSYSVLNSFVVVSFVSGRQSPLPNPPRRGGGAGQEIGGAAFGTATRSVSLAAEPASLNRDPAAGEGLVLTHRVVVVFWLLRRATVVGWMDWMPWTKLRIAASIMVLSCLSP